MFKEVSSFGVGVGVGIGVVAVANFFRSAGVRQFDAQALVRIRIVLDKGLDDLVFVVFYNILTLDKPK